MTGEFEFQYPWVLTLLAALPVYAFLRGRSGKHSALLFSSAELVRAAGSEARSSAGRLLVFLRLLVVAIAIVALAGPRLAYTNTEKEAAALDIMLAMDLSWSMMALDMSPARQKVTRFDIARDVLRDFIRKRPDDRMGLLVFSAVPYLASPLTLNHDWLVSNLDRMHVGILGELGTAIGDAITVCAKRLKASPESKSRIIILLTDGDNNRGEVDPVPAAQLAAALGARVYTVGLGVEEPCHLPRFDPGTGKLLLDEAGNVVPTIVLQPANYSVLEKISELSQANSYRATNRRELQAIYNHIDRLEKSEVKLKRFTTHEPLFQWPLMAAFCLLATELALALTRFLRVP
jgi:Ca-activated chloride channel family protein